MYFLYYKLLRRGHEPTFVFRGQTYRYFSSFYLATYTNERAVEIPIVIDILCKNTDKRILEVGNVLSHYFNVDHTIVDKYEISEGVKNLDIVDFKPHSRYDIIVSISTIEHIGWDEYPRDDMKIVRALENLRALLNPGGRMIITIPLGYNNVLDKLLRDGVIKFTEQYYMKKISRANKWKQVQSMESVMGTKYGYPFTAANALIIGINYG